MQIGVIGAGFIARAVATVATEAGHEVMVSNSRTPDTLFSLVISMGCQAGTPAQAAEFGDIVLVDPPQGVWGCTRRRVAGQTRAGRLQLLSRARREHR